MKNRLAGFITLFLVFSFVSVYSQDSKPNAAEEIKKIVNEFDQKTAEEKISELVKTKEKYSVDREEIRKTAYQFLRQNELNKGFMILKANTKFFPDSWEVFNTLGRMLGWFEDAENALVNFEKAQSLNPENESIAANISRIKGDMSDKKNETKEKSKYKCGENTGIDKYYFNQEPPGLTPKIFAPGIISTPGNFEFTTTFTPDGKEIYFTRRADKGGHNVIMVSKWEERGWSAPDTAEFSKAARSNEPHISADGKKMYFGSMRLREGEEKADYGIWEILRKGDSWSKPTYAFNGMYVSTTNEGSVYFTDIKRNGEGGIHKSEIVDNKYQKSVKLNGGVNNPGDGIHPFVSPNEDYILFDCHRKDGYGGEGDIYVAFRDKDGNWGEAYNLGEEINGPGTDFCASVSPDGKYIFYTKNRDIYWVSSEVIEKFRPKN